MAEFQLIAEPITDADLSIGMNRIVERDDMALVSVAAPSGDMDALGKKLKTVFKLDLPEPTQSSTAGDMRAVRTAADQLMLVFPHSTPDAEPFVQGKLKGAGYTTDQTDVWVVFEVAGPNCLGALERLCPIDLDASVFPDGASARTVMEHMGAMIIRLEADRYLLMSASSSAQSFLHAVETSFHYVTD